MFGMMDPNKTDGDVLAVRPRAGTTKWEFECRFITLMPDIISFKEDLRLIEFDPSYPFVYMPDEDYQRTLDSLENVLGGRLPAFESSFEDNYARYKGPCKDVFDTWKDVRGPGVDKLQFWLTNPGETAD